MSKSPLCQYWALTSTISHLQGSVSQMTRHNNDFIRYLKLSHLEIAALKRTWLQSWDVWWQQSLETWESLSQHNENQSTAVLPSPSSHSSLLPIHFEKWIIFSEFFRFKLSISNVQNLFSQTRADSPLTQILMWRKRKRLFWFLLKQRYQIMKLFH